MKRSLASPALVLALLTAGHSAAAAEEREGFAVVGVGAGADIASVTWPLAQAVYASPRLRPPHLKEDEARALAGEAPKDASPRLRDLFETRSALRGEDGASVRLLASLAQTLGVRGFITVRISAATGDAPQAPQAPQAPGLDGRGEGGADGGAPDATATATSASEPKTTMTATARIFLAETQSFDAAVYAAEGTIADLSWTKSAASMDRAFGRSPAPKTPATANAGTPFYKSFWFWGAMGAAALLGGTAFLLTRDSSPTSVHLRAEVPR